MDNRQLKKGISFKFVIFCLILLANLFFSPCLFIGCAGSSMVPPASESIVVECELPHLWQCSQRELKDRGFRLDRVDLRAGVIQTYPRLSSQWFEVWTRDVASWHDRAEASLHTIRRQTHLKIKPVTQNKYNLTCTVTVQRLSTQSSKAGSPQAKDISTDTVAESPIWNSTNKNAESEKVWINLGPDPALEIDILQSIKKSLINGK